MIKNIFDINHFQGTLKYRSALLRYILTFIHLPFYMLGSRGQQQTIEITLKDNYIENTVIEYEIMEISTFTDFLWLKF